MKPLLTIILALLLVSCGSQHSEHDSTFFGGKIINPKSNIVMLLKDDVILDTLELDEDNRFMESYEDIEEGLYTFRHGAEFQYIYLMPNDSLLLRLNTWDFDESLVFSGKGAGRNDYLISLFLQNEIEEREFYKNFELGAAEFQIMVDELISQRMSNYQAFVENEGNISKGFEKLAHTAIHLPLYRLKEVYPFYHKRAKGLENLASVTEDFYDYRSSVDMNDGSLLAFYPYQNYLTSYLYHISDKKLESDHSSEDYTNLLLTSVVEEIEHEDIRNSLLQKIVVSDFLKSGTTCSMDEKSLEIFLKYCTNEESINKVKSLVHDSKAVCNDTPLENFEVISYDDQKSLITDHIEDQNAVLYFWSTAYHSSEYILKNVSYLEKNFPEISFIGINLEVGINNSQAYEDVKNEPNLKRLDISRQFKLTPESSAHNFLTSSYPRVIIVDDNGVVSNSFTYLDVKKLTPQLKKLNTQ